MTFENAFLGLHFGEVELGVKALICRRLPERSTNRKPPQLLAHCPFGPLAINRETLKTGFRTTLPLNRHGHRVPPAQTQRGNPAVHIPADHFVDQGNEHARSAGSDRMPQSHRTSVHVDAVHIEA